MQLLSGIDLQELSGNELHRADNIMTLSVEVHSRVNALRMYLI